MSRFQFVKTTETFNALEESLSGSTETSGDSTEASTGSDPRRVMGPEDLQVAHELRTPLTALKSAIELLCQSDLPDEGEHLARIAQRNVDRMAQIVEAMLVARSTKS